MGVSLLQRKGLRWGKAILRWAVMAATILFLGHALRGHGAEVKALLITSQGTPVAVRLLAASLSITLLAHGWSGWVWSWILQALQQPIDGRWALVVYLKTNLWKYLPGNLWHFYGRIQALRHRSIPLGPAVVGVILDPVLMAAAALLLGLAAPTRHWPWQLALLILVLAGLHPVILNPLLEHLGQSKLRSRTPPTVILPTPAPPILPQTTQQVALLNHYPLKPLAGAMGFVLLRGVGFGLIIHALNPLAADRWLTILGRFSFAWLAGLVIPGAPGGLGVFEALALPLLQDQMSVATILTAVALYRLMSTLAEAIGAAVAYGVFRSHDLGP